MDASNYTGPLTDQGCHELLAAGIQGVIVQAVTGLDGHSYTRQQLSACVANGLRIQGYVYCNHGQSVASRLPMYDGFPVETIWLDVEASGLTKANVNRDFALIDTFLGDGDPAGCYSGHWYFQQQGWLKYTKWADEGRALWNSAYDGIADPDVGFVPYGGWQQCAVKQYRGTSSIGSVQQIDLDAARP